MYYGAGTYEAFAHPEKPEGVDKKSAYIIGTGLAGLSAAFYLVRDGQVKGVSIFIYWKNWNWPVALAMVEKMLQKAFTCVAAVKWITILNACGICIGMSHLSRQKVFLFWTNTIG